MHLYTGEEAVAATVCSLLSDEKYHKHEGYGHDIAKNGDPKAAMAELMGKKTGFCKGRSGSMHIADLKKATWTLTRSSSAVYPLRPAAPSRKAILRKKRDGSILWRRGVQQGNVSRGPELSGKMSQSYAVFCT